MVWTCPNCGSPQGTTKFEGETFTVHHAGMTAKVNGLSGWRCASCGEIEFDADCAQRYAAAGDALIGSPSTGDPSLRSG